MAQATEAPAGTTAEGPTQHTQNQVQGLAKLRVPFPQEQISPLPKIICGECSRSRTKVCENPRHAKSKCKECGNYITQAHMHLDYVGHAELTNRLLEADPLWDWEPLALNQRGLPQFDENGGLWIRLTVCGHTRLGYGDAQGKPGPNAIKEAIGDALRNAAMRFGAALDLWAKSDLREAQSEHPKTAEDDGYTSERPAAARQERPAEQAKPAPSQPSEQLERLLRQVSDCWNSNNVLIFNQIGEDASQHGVLDEEFTDKRGAVTTLRKILDGKVAEIQAAQGGDAGRSAA
ncbi:hypothetical protein ACIQUW_33175 [Streptomyces sp. NPDC101117]|uniref:hypothetical protein n=1 Tax=Streptomyces sp. NPDC101117 TaxID=3366108 RepID=UPI00381AB621